MNEDLLATLNQLHNEGRYELFMKNLLSNGTQIAILDEDDALKGSVNKKRFIDLRPLAAKAGIGV